jgi:hypothetical protein
MVKPVIIESEYEITENDPNVTISDVSADVEGVVVEFKVPRKTAIILRPTDTLSFYAKDDGTTPTEIPDTCPMKLRHTDPNEIIRNDLKTFNYLAAKEFRDRDLIYKLGVFKVLKEDTKLQILVKPTGLSAGATKLDSTTVQLRITCKRVAELIPL